MADPIDEAKAEIKKHAGRALARREQLGQELTALASKRDALLEDRAHAEAAGAAELVGEIDELLGTMNQQIALLEEQQALASNTVTEITEEMRSLEGDRSRLERDSLVGRVRVLTATDPVALDPRDRALANVRAHAADMEARLELEAELAGKPSSSELRRLQEEQREAELRAQLEELKAKRKGRSEASEPNDDEDAEAGSKSGSKRPKRTL